MAEKTNQEIYDKMIEGLNAIIENTNRIKTDTFNIKDRTDPTYHNVRDIYSFTETLVKKVASLESRIIDLEEEIRKRGR